MIIADVKTLIAAIALAVGVLGLVPAVPAQAVPVPEGCERVPIFGLDPKIRKICDGDMRPDGSWMRYRQYTAPRYVGTPCVAGFPADSQLGNGCPLGTHHTFSPAWESPIEEYLLTSDTIPPGEPGYLG